MSFNFFDDIFGNCPDEDPDSLWSTMKEDEEEDAKRRFYGISEQSNHQHPPEEPSPVAKSPRKRANYFSDLVERLVESKQLLVARENGQVFFYEDDGGLYRPISHLNSFLVNFFDEYTKRGLLAHDVREIAERLTWVEEIQCGRDSFNQDPFLINLKNGVFCVDTGILLEHSPRFRFTYQVEAEYLENQDDIHCPAFELFCQSSLDGDADKRQLLLEFIGYICSDSNAGKCALFLKGQPNTGKSVISEFITRLFDPALVSNIPLHQLGDRFFRAELAGKKLNVAGEIAGRALRDISIFKSITGNDRITGEFNGRDPFYFTSRCKLLFSGNTLPQTTEADATAAYANRIKVLLFNQSVPPEKQDKWLPDKLWDERNSIVTLALQAYQELVERNFRFTLPADSKLFVESFALRGNVLGGFLEECCVCEPGARVFNTELYAAFAAFCKRNGVDCIPRKQFYELLSGIPYVAAKRLRIGTENRQGHEGIRLKEFSALGTAEPVPQSLGTQGFQRSSNLEPHIIDRREP